MASSWPKFASECKSRLSNLARSLFLSRQRNRELKEHLQREVLQLREEVLRYQSRDRRRLEEIESLEVRIERLVKEKNSQAVKLPPDPPTPGQHYGVRTIQLCVNLARKLGFSATVKTLHEVFQWLGVEQEIPSESTIRNWAQRIGVARMDEVREEGAVWFIDEAAPVGNEKALTILSLPQSKLSEANFPLKHEDMDVLATRPGESWKHHEIAEVLKELCEKHGAPCGIVCDKAHNLREAIKELKKLDDQILCIGDLKHFLAGQFKAILERDLAFKALSSQLKSTHAAIQQTNISFLVPPRFHRKARFMNMEKIIEWAQMVVWELDHPESQARQLAPLAQLNKKLGWVRQLSPQIEHWIECQRVISQCLKFGNKHGVYRGATAAIQKELEPLAHCEQSKELVLKVVEFYVDLEQQLASRKSIERLPVSTEILESSFALYRLVEHKATAGLTKLLPAFPTILKPVTTHEILNAFNRVKVKHVKEWLDKYLPNTVQAKKQRAYREAHGRSPATSCMATT